MTKTTQSKKYLSWRWRVRGPNSTICDAFDEIDEFLKSATFRGVVGRGSRNRRKRRNRRNIRAGAGGWGVRIRRFATLLTKSKNSSKAPHCKDRQVEDDENESTKFWVICSLAGQRAKFLHVRAELAKNSTKTKKSKKYEVCS